MAFCHADEIRNLNQYIMKNQKALSGRVFVLTGNFLQEREHIASNIRELGGVVYRRINARTTDLIAGDNAGSKILSADKRGINVMFGGRLEDF